MKKRVLTGDRPTGKITYRTLFCGSLKKRVEMQNSGEYDMYILIADVQALTDNFNNPRESKKKCKRTNARLFSMWNRSRKKQLYIYSQ